MFTVLGAVALAVVATGVVWVGSTRLERSADPLAAHYQLPPVGVTNLVPT